MMLCVDITIQDRNRLGLVDCNKLMMKLLVNKISHMKAGKAEENS